MDSALDRPAEVQGPSVPRRAAVRDDLLSYVKGLKESPTIEVTFPDNFEAVVRCMTREDLHGAHSAAQSSKDSLWSKQALDCGVADALAAQLDDGRYASVLCEDRAGGSAAQLMVGMAQIRSLDQHLQRESERAKRVHEELSDLHTLAQESDDKLDGVLEEVRHTSGLHRQPIGRERRGAGDEDRRLSPRSEASTADSDLLSRKKTFITAVRSDGDVFGASSPTTTRRRSAGGASASRRTPPDFVRENAERAARHDGLSEEEASRLELLLDDEETFQAAAFEANFATDAELQKRLEEIDHRLLTANFGAVTFSATKRNVQMGSLGLAALKSRGVALPPPLLSLTTMPFFEDPSSAADASIPVVKQDRKESGGAAEAKLPDDDAAAPDAKAHGKQNLKELKKERARRNALSCLDRAIHLLRTASDGTVAPKSAPPRENGLLRPISAQEIRVATSEALQRLQLENAAIDEGGEAEVSDIRPSLAPRDRVKALAEPFLSVPGTASEVEPSSARRLQDIEQLVEEARKCRDEIALVLAELGDEAKSIQDEAPPPRLLDPGPAAGPATSAAWELKSSAQVTETATTAPQSGEVQHEEPATEIEPSLDVDAAQRDEEAAGAPGLTLDERKWLRKSDRARRRRMHQIERDARIRMLEELISEHQAGARSGATDAANASLATTATASPATNAVEVV